MMKKPAKCVAPKRDGEQYNLTARDMHNLINLVKEANDILAYYINMPENKSGDLATTRVNDLTDLAEQVEDLQTTINYIMWE